MGEVVVVNWISLDGVVQGPGRADEDTRDGFTHSGWAAPYAHPQLQTAMGAVLGTQHAWLFGRYAYEGLLASWNEQGGPFKDALNGTTKYVASHDPDAVLRWPNSVLLTGDVPARVAQLRAASEQNLVVMGSAVLIQSLRAADLVDRYLLMIAPLVLGSGRRLFPGGVRGELVLCDCTSVPSGAVVATYEPVR